MPFILIILCMYLFTVILYVYCFVSGKKNNLRMPLHYLFLFHHVKIQRCSSYNCFFLSRNNLCLFLMKYQTCKKYKRCHWLFCFYFVIKKNPTSNEKKMLKINGLFCFYFIIKQKQRKESCWWKILEFTRSSTKWSKITFT